nr:N-6 DNA methylase [Motilibacter peucedani]
MYDREVATGGVALVSGRLGGLCRRRAADSRAADSREQRSGPGGPRGGPGQVGGVRQDVSMSHPPAPLADTPALRKARGAFFTPDEITAFMAQWAITSVEDHVLDPSAGDAAFLSAAVTRLRELGGESGGQPVVDGVEIHEQSARIGRARVRAAGGDARFRVSDFFLVSPSPTYDAVIGNPPYVRYQGWTGPARSRSREAALQAGVSLTGLASSWAAFTVHSALFLKEGGRLALVLPAELLSVNYAAPVRRFLFDHFRSVELVLFDEQVFPEAEADVVLLLADGYGLGPTDHAVIRQARGARDLRTLGAGTTWTPPDPSGKWTGSLVSAAAIEPLAGLAASGLFSSLETWGDTTLGIVTGANSYFTLSPARVSELGLRRSELLRLSPPGSAHLRGLVLSARMLTRLGAAGQSTYLFYPGQKPSPAAMRYIEMGHATGVDDAYKCRVRRTWYQVPLVRPADLLLTCMNADTPRLTTNQAQAHHLNSVHGVYLRQPHRELGADLLPLASLNSLTLLNAEMVGRSYGGGILKLEPKEADVWSVPSPNLVADRADALRLIRRQVARTLRVGRLLDAVAMVDDVLLVAPGHLSTAQVAHVRNARDELVRRRMTRSNGAK